VFTRCFDTSTLPGSLQGQLFGPGPPTAGSQVQVNADPSQRLLEVSAAQPMLPRRLQAPPSYLINVYMLISRLPPSATLLSPSLYLPSDTKLGITSPLGSEVVRSRLDKLVILSNGLTPLMAAASGVANQWAQARIAAPPASPVTITCLDPLCGIAVGQPVIPLPALPVQGLYDACASVAGVSPSQSANPLIAPLAGTAGALVLACLCLLVARRVRREQEREAMKRAVLATSPRRNSALDNSPRMSSAFVDNPLRSPVGRGYESRREGSLAPVAALGALAPPPPPAVDKEMQLQAARAVVAAAFAPYAAELAAAARAKVALTEAQARSEALASARRITAASTSPKGAVSPAGSSAVASPISRPAGSAAFSPLAQSLQDLGDGWALKVSLTAGAPYFWNEQSATSSWVAPKNLIQPGWIPRLSASTGTPFWYNSATGASQWDPPRVKASAEWVQERSKRTGLVFWKHARTGECVWEKPTSRRG
jgi:WW domain